MMLSSIDIILANMFRENAWTRLVGARSSSCFSNFHKVQLGSHSYNCECSSINCTNLPLADIRFVMLSLASDTIDFRSSAHDRKYAQTLAHNTNTAIVMVIKSSMNAHSNDKASAKPLIVVVSNGILHMYVGRDRRKWRFIESALPSRRFEQHSHCVCTERNCPIGGRRKSEYDRR